MTRWQIVSLVFTVLFVLAAALLYLNRWLIRDKYYLWISYKRAVSLFSADPVTGKDVVFLGDSLTELFPLREMFPHVAVKNRGISGDTTAGVLRRLDEVTAGHPRQIFLMIGTNDLGFGYSKHEAVANYDEILRRIKQEAPDTEVYVQSLLPRQPKYATDIGFVNREIAGLAEEHGCIFINLFPAFADDQGGLRAEYTDDDLHLSYNGYAQWMELIASYVAHDRSKTETKRSTGVFPFVAKKTAG